MSLTKLLLEKAIHHTSIDQLVSFLRKNDIPIADKITYYIDSGANADVYNVKGSDKVIKIERYGTEIYNTTAKMQDITSDHIVNIYYLTKVNLFTISVMEKLEPSENYISIRDKNKFNGILLYMEGSMASPKLPYYYKKRSNPYNSLKKIGVYDNDILEEFEKTFTIGDRTLQKILGSVLLRSYHNVDNETLEDAINNKQIIIDAYYGLIDMHDVNAFHGDVHIDNIMYDTKTNNFKLIDPWAI